MDYPVQTSHLATLKAELKQYIEQRLKVQTMLLLNAEIEGLKARRDKARDLCLNQAMQIEGDLLDAQIAALEEFRNKKI